MGETKLTAPAEKRLRDRSLEELERRATKDELTGLLNRATMEQCIKERLETMTQEETCALFIVDLDNFKQVNDTLGHQAGDQAIRQSARILSGLFRASDIVGRLGGDEFVVFLCGHVTKELARAKAAAICEGMHLVMGAHEIVNVTASVGVHLAERGQKFEGLYQSADLALYKAKKAGKNRFCLKSQEGYQEAQRGDFRPVNTITLSGLLEKMESGVALLEMGETPQVIYVSPSFCRIIGADPETYPLPKPLSDLIHPDDQVALLDTLREGLRQGKVVEHTHRVCAGDGQSWRWWQIRAAEIEYDAPEPVMLITTMDISRFKEVQQRQAGQIQRLRAAFEQTSKRIWEVDLSTRTFRSYLQDGKPALSGDPQRQFPDSLIDSGWVHACSAARFRSFAQALLGGQARGYGNFAIRSGATGCYGWMSLSYRMLYDEVGRAIQAVGVLEELPQRFVGPDNWAPDQFQMPERLMPDLIMRMRANLDEDRVETLWSEGVDLSGQARKTRCSDLLGMESQHIFPREMQGSIQSSLDREQILRAYREGRHWVCLEYRRADSSGNIRWVRCVLYLTEHPVTQQVYLFAYLLSLDPDHQIKPAICREARHDPVTRLFERETMQRMAEQLFSVRTSGNRAVAVLQINGLEPQPDKRRDQARYSIAAALSLILGGSCLLGQYSDHQIVILFPNEAEKSELRRILEDAIAALRRFLEAERLADRLRLVVGVDWMPASSANYISMLAQAVGVCTFWWNAAEDMVAFAQEREASSLTELYSERKGDMACIHASEMIRPLSAREKDVAFDCVSAMLTARTLAAALQGVLQTVGAYYRADRVYTLELVEGQSAVIMTFEWVRPGRRSIQQAVRGMKVDHFPLLTRCLAQGTPLSFTRKLSEGGEDQTGRLWHFSAFPLVRRKVTTGFLCIENAREHPLDTALFTTLIPYMMQQQERFGGEEQAGRTSGQQLDIPDASGFTEALRTLTSEHYSSMGVVCLDVPNFAVINSRQGFEYGGRLLGYVVKTMTEIFGSALLFRASETEFVVFHPNTTREVFLGRCGRLRSILQRRYPKHVRIGRAWSEGVFTGKRLVRDARLSMQAEYAALLAEAPLIPAGVETLPLPAAEPSEFFTVYYQPKIDLCTGALVGVEALARGVGEDGSILPPSRFIPLMEEDGTIRELDLFVLDRALAQVDQWYADYQRLVPVSVNFSRVTLAHSTTLASILAIQSRYPKLPPTALELEITERGKELGTSELQSIVDQYHACGLYLSLDDFGAQYSNLSLFTNVRFDSVKLDRSLITGLVGNPINRALVQDIFQICQANGIVCLAEGVETDEQVSALLEIGCLLAQGYYYDKPLSVQAFEEKYLCRSPAETLTEDKET